LFLADRVLRNATSDNVKKRVRGLYIYDVYNEINKWTSTSGCASGVTFIKVTEGDRYPIDVS
jgi:hypothetical protein